jgi:hypothetical protein
MIIICATVVHLKVMRYMDDKDKGRINLCHKIEDVEMQKSVDVCAWDFLK